LSTSRSSVLAELREMNGQKFIDRAASPVKVILWRLLIQPLPPKKSAGVIELTKDTQEAEEIVTAVGKVIDMGSFAYQSKTNAGLDLATAAGKPEVGSFVLFAQYAGQLIELVDEQKTKLRIIDDTEVLAVITDPEQIKRYT
jgi:co-chaperonin GroES (HSP10)